MIATIILQNSKVSLISPRFFFLADQELITVLGGNIRDNKVQRLIKKLFVNVNPILPDDMGIIEVLYTTDGEDLPLCKPVNTLIHPVEGWLAEMLEESKVKLWEMRSISFPAGQHQAAPAPRPQRGQLPVLLFLLPPRYFWPSPPSCSAWPSSQTSSLWRPSRQLGTRSLPGCLSRERYTTEISDLVECCRMPYFVENNIHMLTITFFILAHAGPAPRRCYGGVEETLQAGQHYV